MGALLCIIRYLQDIFGQSCLSFSINRICGTIGQKYFPVRIAREEKVSTLQTAIAHILSTAEHVVQPRLLALYLARTDDGAWWKDDDALDAILLKGVVDKKLKKLRPSEKLDKVDLFGSNVELGDEKIHVLVQLPTTAVPETKRRRIGGDTPLAALWN